MDFLGADDTVAAMGPKKAHEKDLLKQRNKLEWINISVEYFGKKNEKRQKMLVECANHSVEGTYKKRKYQWCDDFDTIMAVKRARAR